MNIVLLGPPGVGKGTMSAMLEKQLRLPRLVTGDLLREQIKAKTEFGTYAASLIDHGKYIPDEEIVAFVAKHLKSKKYEKGVVFDGFPRTIPQAEAMEHNGIHINYIFGLEAPEALLIQRLSNRRMCSGCNAIFNLLTQKPKKAGICDQCNGTLIQREDDKPEVIHKRIKIYHEKTHELFAFYQSHKEMGTRFYTIDATGTPEQIYKRIEKILQKA